MSQGKEKPSPKGLQIIQIRPRARLRAHSAYFLSRRRNISIVVVVSFIVFARMIAITVLSRTAVQTNQISPNLTSNVNSSVQHQCMWSDFRKCAYTLLDAPGINNSPLLRLQQEWELKYSHTPSQTEVRLPQGTKYGD